MLDLTNGAMYREVAKVGVEVPEPCTITYVGDGYLVHPVQVCVPMNNRSIPGTM